MPFFHWDGIQVMPHEKGSVQRNHRLFEDNKKKHIFYPKTYTA